MNERRSPRFLDRPITFFGLEIEDLAAVLILASAVMVLASPILAVPVGFAFFFLLRRLKEGKPPGYLWYLLYRSGLVRLLPRGLRGPHLLEPPPIRVFGCKAEGPVRTYSPVPDRDDPAAARLAARYHGARGVCRGGDVR